jgi:hypothetical protein
MDEIVMRNGHIGDAEFMARGTAQPVTGARTALRRNRERALTLPAPHRPQSLCELDKLNVADVEFLVRYHEEQAAAARAELAHRAA